MRRIEAQVKERLAFASREEKLTGLIFLARMVEIVAAETTLTTLVIVEPMMSGSSE